MKAAQIELFEELKTQLTNHYSQGKALKEGMQDERINLTQIISWCKREHKEFVKLFKDMPTDKFESERYKDVVGDYHSTELRTCCELVDANIQKFKEALNRLNEIHI